jgi:Tol biopolymer transport system component
MTRFDRVVLAVILLLVTAIGLTAFFGISEPSLRVAFLRIDNFGVYNLWLAPVDDPDDAERITDVENGSVFDFDVSGDGQYIAYTLQNNENGSLEIMLLDLRSDVTTQITNCLMQDAVCTTPRFDPSNPQIIAYQRRQLNTALGLGAGRDRVWILDREAGTTYALFDDSELNGYSPTWSADGSHLAFYENTETGIMVYDFTNEDVLFIQSDFGVVGTLAPDGSSLIYPEIILDGVQARAYLQIVDLETGTMQVLTDPSEQADDQSTAWTPDGRYVAVGRRYLDERFTRGTQVYLRDMVTSEISPLIVDERFSTFFFSWNADGTQLVMQRFQQLNDEGEIFSGGRPEVWTYNIETRKLTRITDNGERPLWVAR